MFALGVLIVIVLLGMYFSAPSKIPDILGILLGILLGLGVSLYLQQRTTKDERRQRRCSEILVPLYTWVETAIKELKYENPVRIDDGAFEEIRLKELYILSSQNFKEKIDSYVETMKNYRTYLDNARNPIQTLIAKKMMEGFFKYHLDEPEDKESFGEEYFLHWAVERSSRIDWALHMVLKHDTLEELGPNYKAFFKTELYGQLSSRVSKLHPDKTDDERWKIIVDVSEWINNAILNSLFENGYLTELRQRKKKLEDESSALKSYLADEIQEFKID